MAKGDAGDIGAALIDANDVVILRHRQFGRTRRSLDDAGAIDENLDRTGLRLDGGGAFLSRPFVANVDAPGLAADLLGDAFGAIEIAVEHKNFRAVGRQFPATRRADAARSAGDDGNSLDFHALSRRRLSQRRHTGPDFSPTGNVRA
jgi:hypothetical protein